MAQDLVEERRHDHRCASKAFAYGRRSSLQSWMGSAPSIFLAVLLNWTLKSTEQRRPGLVFHVQDLLTKTWWSLTRKHVHLSRSEVVMHDERTGRAQISPCKMAWPQLDLSAATADASHWDERYPKASTFQEHDALFEGTAWKGLSLCSKMIMATRMRRYQTPVICRQKGSPSFHTEREEALSFIRAIKHRPVRCIQFSQPSFLNSPLTSVSSDVLQYPIAKQCTTLGLFESTEQSPPPMTGMDVLLKSVDQLSRDSRPADPSWPSGSLHQLVSRVKMHIERPKSVNSCT